MKYTFIKDYKHDEGLRRSFDELTQKTFGFRFEEWYQNGYWSERYLPYSLLEGNRVIANVSVNRMDITIDGEKKSFLQLGTVMTEETYRNQGLGRYLIETVLEEYKDKFDGIYLFANESVLDYYPKFGFHKSMEYRYRKYVKNVAPSGKLRKVDMSRQENINRVMDTVRNMAVNNNLHMDNYGLYAFYLTGVMIDQIYYSEKADAYIVADLQGDTLYFNQIIAKQIVDPEIIIEDFGAEVKEAVLGFVPINTSGYILEEHKEEDCTLFILGDALTIFDKNKLRFPVLSHA